ncbi:MAG: glutamate mutase L, partial [Firmicutes bacterium]|nr:glutamate mutase L [Candidatus Fermentithermobacillaceae bacterium]
MLKRILVADVGSTFTSVSLLEATGDDIHIIDSSASPTTVNGNGLDVMVGVKNAVEKLEERTGITFVSADGLLSPSNGNSGVDCFVSTCSAGGGIKVLAAGLSDQITVESAQRAALGAGAIVTDVLSLNQAAIVLQNIRRVESTPYDMILV